MHTLVLMSIFDTYCFTFDPFNPKCRNSLSAHVLCLSADAKESYKTKI